MPIFHPGCLGCLRLPRLPPPRGTDRHKRAPTAGRACQCGLGTPRSSTGQASQALKATPLSTARRERRKGFTSRQMGLPFRAPGEERLPATSASHYCSRLLRLIGLWSGRTSITQALFCNTKLCCGRSLRGPEEWKWAFCAQLWRGAGAGEQS